LPTRVSGTAGQASSGTHREKRQYKQREQHRASDRPDWHPLRIAIRGFRSREFRRLSPINSESLGLPLPFALTGFYCVNDSLSIIVPVRDVEATLTERVQHLLDVLPDLTTKFEIVVVDDGSADHTVDVARDLACTYPQLRLVTQPERRGYDQAVRMGLAFAKGQTILVQEDAAALSPTDLRRLWSLRHDRGIVMARAQKQPGLFDPDLLERLSTWGQSLRNLARRSQTSGIQMIRRDAAQSLAGGNAALMDVQLHVHDR
jgi:polyisoprenyl-phosphate glycosyltransferase